MLTLELKYFLFGVLFILVFVPIIESLINSITELILCVVELWKSYINVKIVKNIKQTDGFKSENEVQTSLIGFEVPTAEDYYYEEDEVENKKLIGFSINKNNQ